MQEVEGSTPIGGTCPNDFFRSNRPGYPHPVSSELENSGIRVAVGDCSVTERRRWRPPYQTGKTVHVHAKHYKHNKDGRTATGVCGHGSVPLSHSGNVIMRIGIHTFTCISSTGPKLDIWKRETFCSDFLVSGRSFKLDFTFVYMWYTVELQWLEHWWLVYHGWFELILGSLGTNSIVADLG